MYAKAEISLKKSFEDINTPFYIPNHSSKMHASLCGPLSTSYDRDLNPGFQVLKSSDVASKLYRS